jgi:membrane-bound lytic murein transglycosylase D
MFFQFIIKIILIFFFGIFCQGQELPTINVTKEKESYYKIIIENNGELVRFIQNTLAENRIPKYLCNLSLIESVFNKNAVSSANAGGIWQFTKEHAENFNLSSEKRFDIYYSTQVAVKSLKNLYQKYGNWITVVAAYNCGEGNVNKAMKNSNSNKYEKFYIYLPQETKNHVIKFMEVCKVTSELDLLIQDYKLSFFKKNIENTKKEVNKETKKKKLEFIEINNSYKIEVIIQQLNIEDKDFNIWNPTLKNQLLETGIGKLYLPFDLITDFILQKNEILNKSINIL